MNAIEAEEIYLQNCGLSIREKHLNDRLSLIKDEMSDNGFDDTDIIPTFLDVDIINVYDTTKWLGKNKINIPDGLILFNDSIVRIGGFIAYAEYIEDTLYWFLGQILRKNKNGSYKIIFASNSDYEFEERNFIEDTHLKIDDNIIRDMNKPMNKQWYNIYHYKYTRILDNPMPFVAQSWLGECFVNLPDNLVPFAPDLRFFKVKNLRYFRNMYVLYCTETIDKHDIVRKCWIYGQIVRVIDYFTYKFEVKWTNNISISLCDEESAVYLKPTKLIKCNKQEQIRDSWTLLWYIEPSKLMYMSITEALNETKKATIFA